MIEMNEPKRIRSVGSKIQNHLPLAPCALRFFALRSAFCIFLRNFAFCILHFAFCTFIILIGSYSIANADFWDVVSKFHPSLTLQEQYSDNLYLRSINRQEDWITTIYPGVRFSTLPAKVTSPGQILKAPAEPLGIDLDYRLGLNFYAKVAERNYVSHQGTLNTWYTIDRKLDLRLRDYFLQSDEPIEQAYIVGALPGEYVVGIQRERSIYIRNIFEPSIGYRFGRENLLELNYRNNIYENESTSIEDSRGNYINPRVTYWFNIHHGMVLEYGLIMGDFERSPDLTGHMGRGRYTYRFNPRSSFFAEYIYLKRDFQSPGIDYDVHNPSVGVEYSFSRTLSGRVQIGYFRQAPEIGSSTDGPAFDANLVQRTEKTTYNLSFQGGYREDFFTAENIGFMRYYRGIGAITRRVIARLTLGLLGSVERIEYSTDQKDWRWQFGGNASYQIFRWLTVSLDIFHRENDSNIDTADYNENRGIFRLSATI